MVRTKATVLRALRGHPRRPGLRRGRDADPPADQRRRRGPAVPHPPERARPGHAAADRPRARPQAGHDRRRRQGLRDRPHLPQRGPRLHPRRRVLDARGLRGLRRPVHDDGADPGPGRRRGARGRPHRRARRRDGTEIDLEGEWRQAPILELVSEARRRGSRPSTRRPRRCASTRPTHDVELQPKWGAGEIVVELYEQLVEHSLIQPDIRDGLPRRPSSRWPSRTARSPASTRRGT